MPPALARSEPRCGGGEVGGRRLPADVKPLRRLRAVADPAPDPTPAPERVGALVQRVAAGDQAAFAALYDEVAGLVHGIVLRVLRDPSMAEEVTQEVFVELWRQAPSFDPQRGAVKSWVATMAHRRAVDRVRSEQASRRRDDRVGRLEPQVTDPVQDEVEDRLDRDRVGRALGQLTPLQRQTVELAYYGGHTYREVAVLLGLPEGTVKTRIRDGLQRLRAAMEVAT